MCSLDYRFTPPAGGGVTATIVILSNAAVPELEILFSGEGLSGRIFHDRFDHDASFSTLLAE